jgi:hypothetical protein
VLALAARIRPVAVFLDFDRTLCNTKSGAAPVLGKARFNPELVELARGHANVHVVTRQNPKNTSALRAALDTVGLHHAALHCLGRSKVKKVRIVPPLHPSHPIPPLLADGPIALAGAV